MKKFLSIFMLLVLCLGLVACGGGQDDVPEGYQQISDDDVAYRFYAPLDWNNNSSGSIDSVYYSPSDPSMVMVSFYAPDSEQADIDTYWATVEQEYKTLYTDYTHLSSEQIEIGQGLQTEGNQEEQTENGQAKKAIPAIQHTFTAKIGGVEYKIMQVITGHGKHYYTITYMSSPENFDSHLEEVNEMLKVFKFK